jgi:transposase
MSPRRSIGSVGCSVCLRSRRLRPVIRRCRVGWVRSVRSSVSEWKEPAYGAGLARHLAASGITVIEVDRPNRQERRRNGKSDELDAIEAARAALSGRATGHAKAATGNVEALRALLVAKRSARAIRIKTTGQLRHLVVTAPDDLRVSLSGLTTKALITRAAGLRPRPGPDPVGHAVKTAAVTLARRVQAINAEISVLDIHIESLVKAAHRISAGSDGGE